MITTQEWNTIITKLYEKNIELATVPKMIRIPIWLSASIYGDVIYQLS